MKAHECFHCKRWVAEGEAHDCWTTTEGALTRDLSEDLQDAYERLREAAVEFGEQRIYASHHSIMFARRTCYFFVRPKRAYLEVVIFLGRAVRSPRITNIIESSKAKRAHVVRVRHRDEVEAPLTDWLREAYEFEPKAKAAAAATRARPVKASARKAAGPRKRTTTSKTASARRSR